VPDFISLIMNDLTFTHASSGLSTSPFVVWLNLLLPPVLLAGALILSGHVTDLRNDVSAQQALNSLTGFHQATLNIRQQLSKTNDGMDVGGVEHSIGTLRAQAEQKLQDTHAESQYRQELTQLVTEMVDEYQYWITAEEAVLHTLTDWSQTTGHDAQSRLYWELTRKGHENNQLFLQVMFRLHDVELMISQDIAAGQNAKSYLQYAAALLFIYYLVVFMVSHKRSTRKHSIREKNLEVTLRSLGDAVIVTDLGGLVTYMNPQAERLTGWVGADAKGKSLSAVFNLVNESDLLDDMMRKVTQERRIVINKEDSYLVAVDGTRYQIYENGAPIINDDGEVIGVVLVFRDISSELVRKQQEISKNNVFLEEAQKIARLGFWDFDLIEDKLQWSDEIYRIFDLDPEVDEPSYKLFMSTIHPDDRDRVDWAYSESLEKKTSYDIVHRVITGDGIKVVHERCESTYDKHGKPVRSLGVVQDISDQIRNIDEFRHLTAMYKTPTGITITDKAGTIVRVNSALEDLTGYTSSELVGKNPRMFHSGEQDDEYYRNMWQEIGENGMWQGELCNRRKDGQLYYEWLTITAILDDSGAVSHYVGTFQDITEYKKAEMQVESLVNNSMVNDILGEGGFPVH